MGVKIRKNFVFNPKITFHPEELANKNQKSMRMCLQEEIEVQKKLDAVHSFLDLTKNLLGGTTIQEVKANRHV